MKQSILTVTILSILSTLRTLPAGQTSLTAQNITGRVRTSLQLRSLPHNDVTAELAALVVAGQLRQIIKPHLPRRYAIPKKGGKP